MPGFLTRLLPWRDLALPGAAFRNLRVRLLAWYFLLAVCTTGIAIWTTRYIYCVRLDEKAKASLAEEVERFQRTVAAFEQQAIAPTAIQVFDQALASYIPAQDEWLATFSRGELYQTRHPQAGATQVFPLDAEQLQTLAHVQQPTSQHSLQAGQRLFYRAEPLVIDGAVQGVWVVLNDSTAAYQSGTEAIALVLQVSVGVLAGFFVIAWVTAGRILQPLRLINQTARQITASDMTQRIPITAATANGDEITAVATTFNAMLDRLQSTMDGQQEFLKDISHELRTPITIIQGQLETLTYRPEQQPETIALILSELDQMNRLVQDLLLLTKAERPNFLILKPEDLDWLTEELFFKARSLTPERNWQLEAKGLYPVVLDRQRVTQAVLNLVQNAIRHTQPGDTIAMGSIASDGWLRFWIRDTGSGIAPDDQSRIFERFTQAKACPQAADGIGLGLAIVQAIVQAHGGRIELESTLGHGSTFTLILPLEPAAPDLTLNATPTVATRHESHSDR
ncbi:MAG: HAMP domain-containing sensor histidine kinase [Cyanobacteria bacterium P01_H01_bin.121]